jgi:hypothetical protein
MKKLVITAAIVVVVLASVIVSCTNTDMVGPSPGDEQLVTSSCITCHTDKDTLKELAVTEEEATSAETTGEG